MAAESVREIRIGRAGESVMAAQRVGFIFAPEQPALLQDRHDVIDKYIELCGQHGWHYVEAVRRAALDPVFDHVGDALGRTRQREMTARARELTQQPAQRR